MVKKPVYDDKKTYELIKRLLYTYRYTSDEVTRQKTKAIIMTKMLPIIKRIARTIARRAYDPVDDLVQAGSIGLLKAIDYYNAEVCENFKVYAGYLIIGEMKHYIRDLLNTIKVPRHVQELAFRINSFVESLTMEELRDLTSDDIAEALNIPSRTVDFVMQVDRRRKILSLEDINNLNTKNLGFEEIIMDNDYSEKDGIKDSKIILDDMLNHIPPDYQFLIKLYYYDGYNQKQIADYLHKTPMQVSRKLRKAFALLCEHVNDESLEPEILDSEEMQED